MSALCNEASFACVHHLYQSFGWIVIQSGRERNPGDALVGGYLRSIKQLPRAERRGTCIYSEPDGTGSGARTWMLEEDTQRITSDGIGSTAYAEISKDPDGFILKSGSSSWIYEHYKKSE